VIVSRCSKASLENSTYSAGWKALSQVFLWSSDLVLRCRTRACIRNAYSPASGFIYDGIALWLRAIQVFLMGDNIRGNLRPEITASVPPTRYIALTHIIEDRHHVKRPISIENYIPTTQYIYIYIYIYISR